MDKAEIKFRVFTEGEMCEVLMMTFPPVDEGMIYMQYSGFKDIHGKEVYQGDLVSFSNDEFGEKDPLEVKFNYGCFSIDGSPIWDFAKWKDDKPTYRLEHLEIVGNIYEKD